MTVVDPITLEIIQNKLLTNVQQISHRLVRAGQSFMIKEMEDCSASLFDAKAQLLAESANIPIHLNCVGICLRSILDRHIAPEIWRPGDVIITNDPYLGDGSLGSAHTNDIVMFAPVYIGERLVGFSGLMAHHLDIGANIMGTRGWNEEIQQEGTLIPPLKLVDGGVMNQALFDIIIRNTRVPAALENDLLAQMKSLQSGTDELAEIIAHYGIDVIDTAVEQLIDYAERKTRQEIAQIPDGTYKSAVPILDDGYAGGPYWLRVAIEKEGSEICFDFTGTDPQIKGPVNAPLSTTMSAVYYVMRCLTDPLVPNSEGCRIPISIVAPAGSLVNAQPPVAVYQRMVTCHSLVDLVMGALCEAVPERVIADSAGCQYNYCSVFDPVTRKWIGAGEVTPGGLGATHDSDGIDVMACHVTNCAMPAMEATEIEAPIRFLKREYQCDSGGPGRYRGGVGQVVTYEVLSEEAQQTHTSQKSTVPPRGFLGGGSGGSGKWVLNEGHETERQLRYAMGNVELLSKGDTVTFYTTAGGGFGDPRQRDRESVINDFRDGLISEEAMREIYKVEGPDS